MKMLIKAPGTPENHEEAALPLPSKEWYKHRLRASEKETVHLKKKIKALQQTKRRLNETALEIITTIKKENFYLMKELKCLLRDS